MDEEVKKLLKKNLELNSKIYDVVLGIKRHMLWQRIFGFLKLLIFVVPIIIGIIYLPPLVKDAFSQYKEILNLSTGFESVTDQLDINNILEQININKK